MLKNSLFWKVANKEDPNNFSIIFGTIHLGINDHDLIRKIEKSIDLFDDVYTETSLSSENNKYLNQYIVLPDQNEWVRRYSDKKYQKIRKIFVKSYNVDIHQFKFLRPLIIMSMFYNNVFDVKSTSEKIDQFIWNYGSIQGKNLDGIETIEEQVRVMKNISLDYDFHQMRIWAKNVKRMNRNLKSLLKSYMRSDIVTLHEKSSKSLGKYRDLLMNSRNVIMSDRIYESHQKKPAFFSFGAGHLAGKKGVLNLLKKKGLKVSAYYPDY